MLHAKTYSRQHKAFTSFEIRRRGLCKCYLGILIFISFRREQREIIQLMLAMEEDSDDSSSTSSDDDDLEMMWLWTLLPLQKELGCHINYMDIPEVDFQNMFR